MSMWERGMPGAGNKGYGSAWRVGGLTEALRTPSTWPLVFLGPALLLLRVFDNSLWAYRIAAVVGTVGLLAATVEIIRSVRVLACRRKSVAALSVIAILLIGSWLVASRLLGFRATQPL
ncbi:hypothetical protein [Streptomyces erythrochromogenes]|uniref:hypothetical protein n=1 Tax=Streptomyces erythrochromogenes TaxID=285574 RepID=UPI00381C71BE